MEDMHREVVVSAEKAGIIYGITPGEDLFVDHEVFCRNLRQNLLDKIGHLGGWYKQ
jgi:hypothetical protein